MKAAAVRLARQAVRNEGTSDQYRDDQMNVERLGVARERLSPRNSFARQPGTLASQVDQFCAIREPATERSLEQDWYLEVVLNAATVIARRRLLPMQVMIEL